jgi:FecR protein
MPRNRKSPSWWLTLVLCGVILLATSRTAPALERQPAAEIIALVGTAEIKSPGDTRFRPAKLKDKLYQQDQIRTLADSRAKLFFTDESILVLSDNTTIDIAKFQLNPQGGRQSALMKILHGSLRFIVTKVSAADKPDFEIEGKTAVMGIRGTDGVFETRSPDNIYFLSGSSILAILNRTTGQTLNLTPNNFVSSLPGQPLRIGVITPEMRNRLIEGFQVSLNSPPPLVTQPPPPPQPIVRHTGLSLGNPLISQTNPALNTLSPGAQGNNTLVAPLPAIHDLARPR